MIHPWLIGRNYLNVERGGILVGVAKSDEARSRSNSVVMELGLCKVRKIDHAARTYSFHAGFSFAPKGTP